MACKTSVFAFACILLVASQVTAQKESKVYAAQPPLKDPCNNPPTSSPTAPSTPSGYVPSMAPAKAPPSTPTPAVPVTPSGPRTHLGYCVPQCQRRCIWLRNIAKRIQHIRSCVHICTACCEMNNPRCVPVGGAICPFWGSVLYHNGMRICP